MFKKEYNADYDLILIKESLAGKKESLEELIKIHQDYIYNISLKLFLSPDDALDATQEVLIKLITSLRSFKGESQFRTWLYRIAFNHFLNSKKRKAELLLDSNPTKFAGFSNDTEDDSISQKEIEEVRILCSTAMLMCLNREQRLLYIVGEIFNADHNLGAELFYLTPANYRVKLHRAKSDLLNFVSGKCGIINPNNPCRCPKKSRVLIDKGFVNKEDLKFNIDFIERINDVVYDQKDKISDKIQLEMKELFQNSPFQVKQQLDKIIQDIVK